MAIVMTKEVIGYDINAKLKPSAHTSAVDSVLRRHFKTVWRQPYVVRHIALMDWISPFEDYGVDKDELIKDLLPEYDSVLGKILKKQKPINVHFNELVVSEAAVIIKGEDDGSFNHIRHEFLGSVALRAETIQPPDFIYSTLARFNQSVDREGLESALGMVAIDFEQPIDSFRLSRQTYFPMTECQTIKTYRL